MEFFKMLEMLSLGFYSVAGVIAFMGLYLLQYGARCLDAWRKRESGPTDRVIFHLIVAALIGLLCRFARPPDQHGAIWRGWSLI